MLVARCTRTRCEMHSLRMYSHRMLSCKTYFEILMVFTYRHPCLTNTAVSVATGHHARAPVPSRWLPASPQHTRPCTVSVATGHHARAPLYRLGGYRPPQHTRPCTASMATGHHARAPLYRLDGYRPSQQEPPALPTHRLPLTCLAGCLAAPHWPPPRLAG